MHTTVKDADASARWRFYRTVWRWHFYAGLLVLPLLAWLALTGAGFVYHRALDRAVHHHLLVVAPVAAGRGLPPRQLAAAAQAVLPGPVFRYTTPEAADASAQVGIVDAAGKRQVVYLDPATAQVLGVLPDRGTLGWTLRRLHSLDLVGPWAGALVEVAAGWAILLVLTGVFLWWPRGAHGGVLRVRGGPRQRVFWRDLHAVVGVVAGAAVLFLAMSGMPWTWLWGAQVNKWVNGHDFGYPAGVRVQVPMSQQRLARQVDLPWSLKQARVPQSAAPGDAMAGMHKPSDMAGMDGMPDMPGMSHGAAHAHADALAGQAGAIGLDAAVAAFDRRGIAAGYSIDLPSGPRGVYSATLYNGVLRQQRVIHLDQYSGQVLLDMDYADYGPVAKALEWVINVHLGDEFGALNRLVLVLACAVVLLLCVSAAVMWWKRRPAGGLGVPPLPPDPRTLRVVVALLAMGGLLFPLVGVSMLLIWGFDRWFVRD